MKLFQNIFNREVFMTVLFFITTVLLGVCFRDWYVNYVVPEVEWNRNKVQVLAVGGQVAEGGRPMVAPTVITDVGSGVEAEGAKEYIYYDIDLSAELQEYAQDVCEVYNVPFELALAVMHTESRYQVTADNGLCVGLFQINLDYAQTYYDTLGIADIRDPKDNILSGVWYLSVLMAKYDDLNLVLMHYNIGNKADKYWSDGVRETEYTRRVISAELNLKK